MFVSVEMSLCKLIDHVSGSGFSFAVDIDKSFTCLDLRVLICNAKSLSKINFKGLSDLKCFVSIFFVFGLNFPIWGYLSWIISFSYQNISHLKIILFNVQHSSHFS